MEAKGEGKKAAAKAKVMAYEHIHRRLDTNEWENEIFKLIY